MELQCQAWGYTKTQWHLMGCTGDSCNVVQITFKYTLGQETVKTFELRYTDHISSSYTTVTMLWQITQLSLFWHKTFDNFCMSLKVKVAKPHWIKYNKWLQGCQLTQAQSLYGVMVFIWLLCSFLTEVKTLLSPRGLSITPRPGIQEACLWQPLLQK